MLYETRGVSCGTKFLRREEMGSRAQVEGQKGAETTIHHDKREVYGTVGIFVGGRMIKIWSAFCSLEREVKPSAKSTEEKRKFRRLKSGEKQRQKLNILGKCIRPGEQYQVLTRYFGHKFKERPVKLV